MCQHEKALAALAAVHVKNVRSFRASLRATVRRYVKDEIGGGEFIIEFLTAIEVGYRRAWKQGAAACGIKPRDIDDTLVQAEIGTQVPHVAPFRDRLVKLVDGGQMNTELAKVEGFVARYGEQVNKAQVTLCGEKRLKWTLGIAEHCPSCRKLAGIVKPASFWQTAGILPRVPYASYLICGGHNCKCSLQPTNEPITEGSLPSLP